MTEHCPICDQEVESVGPWCDLSVPEKGMHCKPRLRDALLQAEAEGDVFVARVIRNVWREQYPEDFEPRHNAWTLPHEPT